jgi:Uma2 family endonuclease
MANLALAQPRMTADEYLAFEMQSPIKHEFVDGVIYAMSDASDRHGLLTLAFASALYRQLSDDCQAFVADMKLRVGARSPCVFYYPDILVSCAADDRERYFREQPILIVEVLSPSTERVDRTEKLAAYASIPSLHEYVLADQDIPKIEIRRRRTAWQPEIYLPGDGFRLDSVGIDLTIDGLYRRLDFGRKDVA